MKTIVLVAVLAAAGCGKKAGSSDCDVAIGKGIDNFTAAIKGRAPNPQMQASMLTVLGALKGTLTQHCKADKWPSEVVTCFTTVTNMKDMQACQTKLSDDQRAKLLGDIRQVMLGAKGPRMPAGLPGHPPVLTGSSGGAVGEGSAAAPAAPAGSAAAAPEGSAAPAPGSNAR